VGLLATFTCSEFRFKRWARPSLLDWFLLYTTAVEAAMRDC